MLCLQQLYLIYFLHFLPHLYYFNDFLLYLAMLLDHLVDSVVAMGAIDGTVVVGNDAAEICFI